MQNVQESSSLPLEKETARESQRAWQRWNEYSRECDGRQFPWRDVARDDAHDACHLPDRKSISGKRNGKQGFDTRPSRYKQGQGRERVYTSSVDVCHGNGRLDASITAIFSSVTITEQRERERMEGKKQTNRRYTRVRFSHGSFSLGKRLTSFFGSVTFRFSSSVAIRKNESFQKYSRDIEHTPSYQTVKFGTTNF